MYTVTVLHNGDIAEEPLRSQLDGSKNLAMGAVF